MNNAMILFIRAVHEAIKAMPAQGLRSCDAEEIRNDDTPVVECKFCRYESAQDI
jgi:hypothetical protein